MNTNDSQFGTLSLTQKFSVWKLQDEFDTEIYHSMFPCLQKKKKESCKLGKRRPFRPLPKRFFFTITGQMSFVVSLRSILMTHLKDTVGMEIGAWVSPSVFGFAIRFCTAEYAQWQALGMHCTDNQVMKSHWKPPEPRKNDRLPPLLPCSMPLGSNSMRCKYSILPLNWQTSPPMAHLPMATKPSLLTAGTKEGKGRNFDEVIKPHWLARLLKDNGTADSTSLKSCCPFS